ncbi:MAG TPA: tetraacyldisaccharide 4'-kinase [Chryseolinea sp.]|nr:tetraacyldisaccharide 4'-kinase [Chryseolinea sp.]
MIILRILLFPFAVIYNIITTVRNRLYDQGTKASVKFDLPVISVGNLSAGGTGKTPLTEYLIRLLSKDHEVATLSRGYGRATKGFYIANPTDTAKTLGDEPYQFYAKYGDRIVVTVGEERAFAIPNIIQEHPKTDIILLDDAYQHRSVRPSLSILLTEYYRPFYDDFLLPAGRLRESKAGANRADMVVVTKCPEELSDEEMIEIEKSIRKYVEKPVFFTHIRYGHPVPYSRQDKIMKEKVIVVTGISNPKPFLHYVSQNFSVVKKLDFRDHHDFSRKDVEKLQRYLRQYPDASILTTEKDKVKLASAEFEAFTTGMSLFYVPIEVKFNKNGRDFDEIVLNSIRRAG